MKIKLKCINCDSDFETEYKHRDKKYCNRKCYFEYARKNKVNGRKKDINLYEKRNCKVCDTEFEVKKTHKKDMCSDECRRTWNSMEVNKKDRINKSKESLLKKYGVDSIFKLDEKQEKIKNTFIDRYGVDNPMKDLGIKNKLKDSIRDNHLKKLLPKLKENNLELLDDYTRNKDCNTSISYNFKCLKCSNEFTSTVLGSGKIPICRKCYPISKNSSLEFIIKDFLDDNKIKYLHGDRKTLNGLELDFYIPSSGIAIEVNGNAWHSELFGNKDKKYHINKTEMCHKLGIDLIHIFEDELINKREIVFSRLRNKLKLIKNKIYARKCEIKEVSFSDKKKFLNENHIQGNSIDKIRLGLFYENELVSLMTFSKKRVSLGQKSIENNWELNRFSSKINYNIPGAFSKLLKSFIRLYKPKNIVTYADIRWSGLNKNVYNLDFKYVGVTPPNYWYIKRGDCLHRSHRFSFRKDVLVKEGYDPQKTEWEIMQEKGYDRIWDCGNMKYEYNTGASFDDI
jgi:hypothetical protein